MDYIAARKLAAYLTALADANDAVESGKAIKEAEPAKAEDIAAQKVSASNIAIAGSGVKAELCGTISGEPTATVKALMDIGADDKLAEDMVADGKRIRADALALRVPVKVETIEVKP